MVAPSVFLSHGGPTIGYTPESPAYVHLQKFGQEFLARNDIKAILAISAHWSGEPNKVYVNTGESEDIIYDFYGFPKNYYQQKYPNKGNESLSISVLNILKEAGLNPQPVERGLDHGIWV